MTSTHLHATSIDIQGKGVLILGKSGMGKSSLALQLIDRGALLVADDQTILNYDGEKILMSPPDPLKGMMEVRALGLCAFPFHSPSSLELCVELCEKDDGERLPDSSFKEYYGIPIPLLQLKKDDPLGPIKIELKLANRVRADV
jgi:serine kinase of HPr protein (carbohydrate metabolism regulator)